MIPELKLLLRISAMKLNGAKMGNKMILMQYGLISRLIRKHTLLLMEDKYGEPYTRITV